MTKGNTPISVFWFRRDLRLNDNAGLFFSLQSGLPVLPIFIFDTEILDELDDKNDARVSFIHQQIQVLQNQLTPLNSSLLVMHGKPIQVFKQLLNQFSVAAVFTNKDYEPYAIKRDTEIQTLLQTSGTKFFSFKDQVIFEENDILSGSGTFFKVFTPYKQAWIKKLSTEGIKTFSSETVLQNLIRIDPYPIISFEALGFKESSIKIPAFKPEKNLLEDYHHTRDFPAKSTSRIGVHLRFGTVSIRSAVQMALMKNETWLSELIWREFFMMILFHNPHVVHQAFKSSYNQLPWRNDEKDFDKWCQGVTGYPIVDAGMRELNATGFMHNRVRMVTASFLTKHLLIDWRWGEAYFAKKLLDYELASNNGNWQWAASTGTDAQPYFRVFNPSTQAEKFDKDQVYIKKWVPELNSNAYPNPMVDHKFARQRAIDFFKNSIA